MVGPWPQQSRSVESHAALSEVRFNDTPFSAQFSQVSFSQYNKLMNEILKCFLFMLYPTKNVGLAFGPGDINEDLMERTTAEPSTKRCEGASRTRSLTETLRGTVIVDGYTRTRTCGRL